MSPLFERLRENTAILWIKSGGNRLQAKKSIKTNLHFQKAYTVAIEQLINKAFNQVDFKSQHSGNCSGSGRESSDRSYITCHKCGKKVHIKKDCSSTVNGSSGNTPKKSINEIPEWVTRKPTVSDTKYLTTSAMTRNNKKYKWFISYNNGQGAWGFPWKDSH